MSGEIVQPLPQGRGMQPGHRDGRRKTLIPSVARKMAAEKQLAPNRLADIRSPLMERSNGDLQKKPAQIKPSNKKMAEPVNKENIRPVVKRDGKSVSVSQSFLKTRNVKEKQMKDEKVKLESTKDVSKPGTKPVLGAYRGRIVQSKINSFWKNSENKNLPEQSKTLHKGPVKKPQSSTSVPAKTMVKPSNDVKPKRPVIPLVSSQIRPSTVLTKSKAETVPRTTQVLNQRRPVQHKTQPVKPPMKNVAVKKNQGVQSREKSSGPVETLSDPRKNKPAPLLPPASRFPKAKESAEERKARLAEWRKSKDKVLKRPPVSVVKAPMSSVQKEEPEEPQEESRQLYWVTMAEEDEQARFTQKVHQIFGYCQKLIEEGCPRAEVLSTLGKEIETAPEAKKLSGYWECLARLEKRDGHLYKVMAICEEAVSAGAQPMEELRAILVDTLEKLKLDPEESVKEENKEDLRSEVLNTEVKDETASVKRQRRERRRAVKNELKNPSTPEKLPGPESTPGNGNVPSSVIRFNVRSTPRFEKTMELQMNEGESSSIKNYKFLTPVRRSSRLEHKSRKLPDMLKDHDPCVSGIDELRDLEETGACASAYIFQKNRALNEVTSNSATKK